MWSAQAGISLDSPESCMVIKCIQCRSPWAWGWLSSGLYPRVMWPGYLCPCVWLGKWETTRKSPPFLLDRYQIPDLFMPCQHCLGFLPEMKPFALVSALTPFAQKQVNAGQYGPGMSELEKQIAEHNILQKEIEAYGLQIKNLHSGVRHPPSPPCPCHSTGDPAGSAHGLAVCPICSSAW